jgi:hypothetical protein
MYRAKSEAINKIRRYTIAKSAGSGSPRPRTRPVVIPSTTGKPEVANAPDGLKLAEPLD